MMHRSMSPFFFRKVVKTKIHVYEISTHEGRNRIMSASSPTTFVDKYLVQRNISFLSTKKNEFRQFRQACYKMS